MSNDPTSAPPHIVVAEGGTRLEQLHARYAEAKSAESAAKAELKAVVDGIKLELTQAAPGLNKLQLNSPAGVPLELQYVESWRVDAKRLKAEDPITYARFATKGGSWRLAPVQGGDES